jgi:hypothetical protein
MNGKGSLRRPTAVSDKELTRRWQQTFNKQRESQRNNIEDNQDNMLVDIENNKYKR